jgi:acyl carrier protein
MTPDEIRSTVLAALTDVAPEVDPAGIDPGRPLREQLDLDSYDYLRFMVRLHEVLGVDIPETDYRAIPTLDALVEYLTKSLPA